MTLNPGIRLGPYEIRALLGAGGMGEVYRAQDTRLDRAVALKVLPSHLAANPELRERFEREAKAISALSHPHICVLHDVGRQDGIDFLVMEYLEGETLADRLKKGALSLEQVLRHAVEIAEALDRAHRQGIVHRDLKPGNVMLTKSGAKLLDFGLAKLRAPGAQPSVAPEQSSLPTRDTPLTAKGSIVGTFQYMAPEQLEGKEADARTDIFAFGAVLYEMATGKRAFTGKSHASLIGAILKDEPAPISSVQPLTPPALERVVATCLAKDPDDRWQNAHDLASELKWIAKGGSQAGVPAPLSARRRGRERLAWTVAAVVSALLGIALFFVVAQLRERPEKPLQVHFQIPPPEKTTFWLGTVPAVSPDGQYIVFPAIVGGVVSHLYVRALNAPTATRVPATEGGFSPFWSPDGRQIGFVADSKLKKVDLSGERAQTLCDLRGFMNGASWNYEGVIAFSDDGALLRVTANGGQPQPLGKPAEGETGRFWPQFLPDGRRYLYLSRAVRPEDQGIYVASLDSDDRKRIGASDHNAAYSPSGHLLFVRGNALMAQAFDAKRLALSGEAVSLTESVALQAARLLPGAAFSVSGNGVLAWQPGSGEETQLTWFDRSGKKLGTLGEPAEYSNPALSPDEKSLAVGRQDPQGKTRDLWVFDLVRGMQTRLTFDPADDFNPTWSPDGIRIAFTSDRRGRRELYQKLANGSGDDELLLQSQDLAYSAEDWSADGKLLLYNRGGGQRQADLYLLPMSRGVDRKPITFLATEFSEQHGQFAPNGRWIAYSSDETGPLEVYVQGVSPGGVRGQGKWQVSTAGGVQPRWRRDGQELFYVSGSTLMAVDVKTDGASFEAGIPRQLFEVPLPPERRNRFVAARDGQRFLVNTALEQTSGPIHVLVNYHRSLLLQP
jgi:Tol biopolymer transport system component/predicted Ser/Thr protein kinase